MKIQLSIFLILSSSLEFNENFYLKPIKKSTFVFILGAVSLHTDSRGVENLELSAIMHVT